MERCSAYSTKLVEDCVLVRVDPLKVGMTTSFLKYHHVWQAETIWSRAMPRDFVPFATFRALEFR
jgi:hypothetical protein